MAQQEEWTRTTRRMLVACRAHLATILPGKITDTSDLERLLTASWDEFSGDYGGMEATSSWGAWRT